MELFRGRCLLCAAFFFVLSSVFGWFFPEYLTFSLLFFLLLSIAVVLAIYAKKEKISSYRLFSVCTVLLLCYCFVFRCGILYLSGWGRALSFCGDGKTVSLTVTQRDNISTYSSRFTAEITEIDGETTQVKAVLYCGYPADFCPGDELYVENAKISSAKDEWYGYAAEGKALYLVNEYESSVSVFGHDEKYEEGRDTELKNLLSYRLSQAVGGRAGGLCSAMLLGDGDCADSKLRLDFRRAGISHLLSVSGMHLSIIAAALGLIMKKLRFPLFVRVLALILTLFLYLWLLGFPLSALRSCLMLFISYIGIMSGISTDGLSSLSIALMTILMISPESVADSGFILSFSATFGIIAFSPLFSRIAEKEHYRSKLRKNRKQRVSRTEKFLHKIYIWMLYKLLPSVMTVFSVNIMTAVPLACLYGEISLSTPISNLCFPLLAMPVLLFSGLTLIFIDTPAATPVSRIAGYFARLIIDLSEKISDIKGVCISLEYSAVLVILIVVLVLTLLLLSLKLKRRLCVYAPALAGFLCLAAFYKIGIPDSAELYFQSEGTGETAAVVSEGSSVLIDLGTGAYGSLYEIDEFASKNGSTEINALIITHCHTGHSAALIKLGSKSKLFSVWLPKPETADDAANVLRISEAASLCGAVCYMYENGEELRIYGDIRLSFSGIERLSRSSHPVLSFEIGSDNEKVLYLGRSVWESDSAAAKTGLGLCGTAISSGSLNVSAPVHAETRDSPDKENSEASPESENPEALTATGIQTLHIICGNHGPALKTECSLSLGSAATLHFFSDSVYKYWLGRKENRPSCLTAELYVHDAYAHFSLK